ncbi:MAG: hypothetical protein ACKN9T_13175 [Candidatus Methylumidiphilus sp.]
MSDYPPKAPALILAAKLVAAPSMVEGAQGEISKIAHIFGEM